MQKEMNTPTRSILLGLITVALTLPPIYLLASMPSLNWVGTIFLIINLPFGAIMDSLVVSGLLPISSPLRPILAVTADILCWIVVWHFLLSEREMFRRRRVSLK